MKYAIVAALAAVVVALPADDWNNVPKPTPVKNEWEEAPKVTPPPKNEWENEPKKDKKTCTTVYVTKDCGEKKNDWDVCKDVTKTETLYDDKCTWDGWEKPAPKPTGWVEVPKKDDDKKEWENQPKKDDKKDDKKNDWENVPKKDDKKVCTYVTVYTNVYTTKECGDKKDAWDNCKDVTKTETKTETKTDEKCTGTWGEWYTWKAPAAKETWAEAPKPEAPKATTWAEAPKPEAPKAAETWAPANVAKPAASSTVWSPVAKFTGAADKQTVGFGAAAIAAIAMML